MERTEAAQPAAESLSEPSIGDRVGRGLRWSMLGLLVTKLASFTISLVLARLLAPADFGVFAVAMALTAFLMHVNDVGVIAAVIQWPGRLEDMAATAAVMAVAFSTAFYALIYFTAPAFAELASEPKATGVIRVLAAIIVIDGITAVRSGALMRRFQQDKLTMANAVGFLVQAPVSIVLAQNGGGPYSFAVSQLAAAAVTGVLVFRFARVPAEIGFDRVVARRLLRFGIPLAASLGVEAILLNADYVIVGRQLGGVQLGYYLLAFNVATWIPGVITGAIRYVSIAGFSRLAEDDDAGSLSRGVQRTLPALVALMLPLTVLVCALAPQIVGTLYDHRWSAAAAPLRFLIVLLAARVITSFAFDVLTSAGATRSALVLNAGWALVLIPALWVGTRAGGIEGTAVSHAVVAVVVAVPLALALLRRSGIGLAAVATKLNRVAIAGAACALVCVAGLAVVHGSPWLRLIVVGAAGVAGYAAVAVPRQLWSQLWSRVGRSGDAPLAAAVRE